MKPKPMSLYPRYRRITMFNSHKILCFCLILLALLGFTAQAQALTFQTEVDPGDVGNNSAGFLIDFGAENIGTYFDRLEISFSDGKQLAFADDRAKAGFVLSAIVGTRPAFSGFFTDENGMPIAGTEFSGVMNFDAVEVPTAEGTFPPGISWSGVVIESESSVGFGDEFTAPTYYLLWITQPKVVDGQPVGNVPPIADAGGPYDGVVGVDVHFDGSGSSDPDGTIEQYDWDFGDDNTGIGETPTHLYDAPGTYNVILTVTDDGGLPVSNSTTALIGGSSQPPTADANGPYSGQVGVPVTFDGSASDDPDGSITLYEWDFDDGKTGTGETPSNTYAEDGKYWVTLTVTDDTGETDTDFTFVIVGIGNLPPQADAGESVSGKVSRDITFDGSGSSDPGGNIVQYDWDFGDDNTGIGETPTHRYDAPGTYHVTLTVTDSDGATDSDRTLAFIESSGLPDPECVQECRAVKDECLDAARDARDACFEECDDDFECERACRQTWRDAKDDCRAEFRDCRAGCR